MDNAPAHLSRSSRPPTVLGRHGVALAFAAVAATACGSDSPGGPVSFDGPALAVVGSGRMTDRYMAEVWTRGGFAYTSTWGTRGGNSGNAVHIWDISSATPQLVDSLLVEDATTLGDVQVSDDGGLLVVATERQNGSIVVYDLADPRRPTRLTRYLTPNTSAGVHTAEVARVNGKLYAFLSVDPSPTPPRLVIVDLSDPRNPQEVLARQMGNPTIHDVFVRDGILFTAVWHDGMIIWDIGGGGRGGSVSNPVLIGSVRTASWTPTGPGSSAHNIWWFHDPVTGSRRYAFVGEEAPGGGSVVNSSAGDIHVVDVSDMANPREVAFYHLDNAGAHNFSMDEEEGILYAAYYNGGVRALDVRGDLSACTAEQKSADGRCDLRKMGREIASGPAPQSAPNPVFIWGVHFDGSHVYASDMQNGLWKLAKAR